MVNIVRDEAQDKAEEGQEITFSSVDTHKEAIDKIVENFRFR